MFKIGVRRLRPTGYWKRTIKKCQKTANQPQQALYVKIHNGMKKKPKVGENKAEGCSNSTSILQRIEEEKSALSSPRLRLPEREFKFRYTLRKLPASIMKLTVCCPIRWGIAVGCNNNNEPPILCWIVVPAIGL